MSFSQGHAIKQQLSRAVGEAQNSLNNASSLCDKWLAAVGSNPTGLTQTEIDLISRGFKNSLVSLKWDCEDVQELIEVNDKQNKDKSGFQQELEDAKIFSENCRVQLAKFNGLLDDFESRIKLYNKHGLTTAPKTQTLPSNNAQTAASNVSIVQNPLFRDQSERLLVEDGPIGQRDGASGEIQHFDKSQIESNATIFNNALYEHYEHEDTLSKGLHASQVFNNLTRPNDVYMDPMNNENEMILEMLETEYQNPTGGGFLAISPVARYNQTVRKLLESMPNKYLGVLLIPLLFLLFLVI